MKSGLSEKVRDLLAAGRPRDANDTLVSAADGGSAEALYLLATWRVSGQIIKRDLKAARELMRTAAEAGHPQASILHAHFVANGTGGPSDWKRAREILEGLGSSDPLAARQIAMVQRMPVREDGTPAETPALEQLSDRPLVLRARRFLSLPECDYLLDQAAPLLKPSVVTDRATGRAMLNPVRRSDGMGFGVGNEDLVVNAINRRIAALTKTDFQQAEPLQILSYGPGGEFKTHCDFVKDRGNQRILTAIIYLTDSYEGGETSFVRTSLSFRGDVGDLLLFRNVTADGRPDLLTEHAGLPVTSGRKVIASRWIWREPPVFPAPQPLLPTELSQERHPTG